MLKLYQNIYKLRKKNKWTQEELAKRMGYTDRSMIAKIEAGKVDLSQSKILDFAKVFNVDAGDLMEYDIIDLVNDYIQSERDRAITKSRVIYTNVSDNASDEEEKARELYRLYEKVSPEVQQAVELMLKSAQPKP